jgi:peptidoglycan hydrolase-like protein with peptidoglycan-binding domain
MITKTTVFQYTILTTTAAFIGMFVALVFFVLPTQAHAATITSQISLGSSNANVTALQTFLATNPLVYPAGLVTGFYGPMTQTAVAQFQIAYGLPPVGNVGPATLARIQSIMASNAPLDVSAPQMSNVQITKSSGQATLSWTTNEQTRGVVFYDTNPVVSYEVSTALTDPVTTGTPVSDSNISTAHSITLSTLQSGRNYYYIVHSTDLTGNVTITLTGSFVAQ